jgi:amino acid adenylation domain-containing protein
VKSRRIRTEEAVEGARSLGAQVEIGRFPRSILEDSRGPRYCLASLWTLESGVTPNRLAVAYGQSTVTYAELDARATALACRLSQEGAIRGSLVGLLADRSIAHIVGALGILKAGAAYLPLQPADPERRLNFELSDAGAELIVVAESCARTTGGVQARRILLLRPDGTLPRSRASRGHFSGAEPEDLAYVIYTSGSTGRPKAVEVTHANLRNLICWHHHAFHVTAADRASWVSSVGVDASVWELWPYLAAGASVHIAEDTVAKDAEALRDWLIAERITISFAPTPLAERLMELKWPSKTELRILLTGGDTLHSYPAPNLPFQVVNNYGPTECTVVATSAPLTTSRHGTGLPPIGKPISNTRIFILDRQMKPVGSSEEGEIWIGGAGVARGYRHRPEMTAESFRPNPLAGEPGERVYRTGDRGRWLPDGQIAFLGRTDKQIKIRGFRVEPGEIEFLLDQHPAVEQSSVNLWEPVPGEKRLIAHVVLKKDARRPSSQELQAFLGEHLPEYSVPVGFVGIRKLPLLESGKIDRSALRPPGPQNRLSEDSFARAETILERKVEEIASSLLGGETVSVEDNFFMRGGHSLLATQLIARVRDVFGVDISLRFLFEFPTVRAIAAEIERIVRLKLQAMTDEEAQYFLDHAFALVREGK